MTNQAARPQWSGLRPFPRDHTGLKLANLRTPGFGKLLLLGPQQETLGLQLIENATHADMADR
jgi:hypothetical protein